MKLIPLVAVASSLTGVLSTVDLSTPSHFERQAQNVCESIKVFQKDFGLNAAAIDTIQAAIDLANLDGANICWDGSTITTEAALLLVLGTFDILLGLNPDNGNPIWTDVARDAIGIALGDNVLQKLFVYDRFCDYDVKVPGLAAGQVVRSFYEPIMPLLSLESPNVGPAGTVGEWSACSSNHGYIIDNPDMEVHFVRTSDQEAVSVEYCFGNKVVYYSTTPQDFYLAEYYPCDYPVGSANNLFKNTIAKLAQSSCNSPPSCPNVIASKSWVPPNNKFVAIDLSAYPSDPEGALVSLSVISCASSDPYHPKGGRDCLLDDQSDLSVFVRAKRSGNSNGRLYRIGYTAEDEFGETCTGLAYVCIPHDASIERLNVTDENDLANYNNTNPSGKIRRLCPIPDDVTWYDQLA
jgi:hypothetical protein